MGTKHNNWKRKRAEWYGVSLDSLDESIAKTLDNRELTYQTFVGFRKFLKSITELEMKNLKTNAEVFQNLPETLKKFSNIIDPKVDPETETLLDKWDD